MEEFVDNFNLFKEWLYNELKKKENEGSSDEYKEIYDVVMMFECYDLDKCF